MEEHDWEWELGGVREKKKMGELPKRVGWAEQLLEMVVFFNNSWGRL